MNLFSASFVCLTTDIFNYAVQHSAGGSFTHSYIQLRSHTVSATRIRRRSHTIPMNRNQFDTLKNFVQQYKLETGGTHHAKLNTNFIYFSFFPLFPLFFFVFVFFSGKRKHVRNIDESRSGLEIQFVCCVCVFLYAFR